MRRIRFCAGHRLYQHGGKCEFFHGHNYIADIYVSSDVVDGVGRVIDFADLKTHFKGWIDENWDHGFLIHEADKNAWGALQLVEPSKVYRLPYNPTAENMARYLLENVAPGLLDQLAANDAQVTKVAIWETPESCAEATLSLTPEGSQVVELTTTEQA